MKKKTLVVGLVAILLLAAVGFAVKSYMQKDKGDDKKKAEAVLQFSAREVVQPVVTALPQTVAFSGPLVAPQTAMVRAKTSGTLLSLTVAEGSRVKAGQPLGRVDTTDMDNRLAERRAMLESARATAAQAERTHASNQKLADEKFISNNALDASRVALDGARAQARAAQAQLGTVQAAASLATLVAPIDGIVAKRHVVAGEKLSPEQMVVTIIDVRRLEIAANVGTHEVGLLKVGMPLQVTVEGVAKPLRGVLARVAPAAEAGTRSIAVAVSIDNADEALRAGMYALAKAVVADDTQRVTVPEAALFNTAGQDFVWTVEKGALVRRAVTLGVRDGANGRVEVTRGVDSSAAVVAMRFENLREGQKVTLAASGAAPAASGIAPTPTPVAPASVNR
jgi:membrane fusion protein, multidrug efflux system